MDSSPDQSSSSSRPAHAPRDALDRLRSFRVRPDRARSLGEDIQRQIGGIRKISRTEAGAIAAWNTAAPDEVTEHCRVGGMKAGKLIVLAPGSSQRYLADRWLRSGGLAELQALARVPIRGVEIRIDPKLGAGGDA